MNIAIIVLCFLVLVGVNNSASADQCSLVFNKNYDPPDLPETLRDFGLIQFTFSGLEYAISSELRVFVKEPPKVSRQTFIFISKWPKSSPGFYSNIINSDFKILEERYGNNINVIVFNFDQFFGERVPDDIDLNLAVDLKVLPRVTKELFPELDLENAIFFTQIKSRMAAVKKVFPKNWSILIKPFH
ncbi:MAG: hypothetical protein KDD40_01030 [Bdellovibrionales bacterium]|nr:hypothetical protein [Bdellovibrionales bacterium]